jgi:hypothetical protein
MPQYQGAHLNGLFRLSLKMKSCSQISDCDDHPGRHDTMIWKQNKLPRPDEARQVCSQVRSIFMFRQVALCIVEFIPPGQTVN